jgi:small-conductance mechanosensitive channel
MVGKMQLHVLISVLGNNDWVDFIESLIIFSGGLGTAFILNKLLIPGLLRLTKVNQNDFKSRIINSIKFPLTLGILIFTGYLAIAIPLDLSPGQQNSINHTAGLFGLVLGVISVASLTSTVFNWYMEIMAPRTSSTLDVQLMPLIRRIVVGAIYALGGLLILDQLNINISPLIAGLGLGGLAVALAIQPTLSNLFAGTYVLTEGVIKQGDYIELEGGTSGYVIDVGWRSTRIKTWTNNLVVIPNSRFAETIITNYAEPHPGINVLLMCGVSYETNLDKLQDVCQEVMDTLIKESPDANEEYGAYFGLESFDDSNISFWLFVQANNRLASFSLKTSLMQHLHKRLDNEAIIINYPVRTLQWAPTSEQKEFPLKTQSKQPSDDS